MVLLLSNREPTPFERIFSRRDLLRGTPLNACLDLTASTLLLAFSLVLLCLMADLLISQGKLTIAAEQLPDLMAVIGKDALDERGDPTANALAEVRYEDGGILPTVWHYRGKYFGPALGAIYRRFSPVRSNRTALVTLVSLIALCGWLRSMLESHARVLLLRTGIELATKLRRAVHRQTLRLGPSDLEGAGSAHAMQLFTAEIDRLSFGVTRWALRMGRDPVRLAALLALAVAADPILAGVCLVPLVLCWYIARREFRRIDEVRALSQDNAGRELNGLAEGLTRTRLVRGYTMEAYEQEQFERFLARYEQSVSQGLKAKTWSQRSVQLLVAACLTFILLFVGSKMLPPHSEISFVSGGLLLGSFALAWYPLQNLVRLQEEHAAAESAAIRLQNYLNQIPEVGQAVGAKFLQPLSRMITFENVSYATPEKPDLLNGLKLKIPAGRQVAIVATDPLEGLAIAYLLPRFIEPQSGKVLIDSEDIAWVTLESLRAETVFVGGKTPYLTGTIRDNISGGSTNFSLQEVTEAAKVTHAHNFISKLPQGYETLIGEHGEQLDPGQCFRLGLARAMLRKPALMIVAEPEEALDDDTKSLIDDAYQRIAVNRTMIYLPQRLSTLKRVDEIALIHKGRLVAIGPRARLVQSSPLYRHWEYIHFNELRHEFETE
jgi:ATP-binding cassette, subfamily B, bacterial